MIRHVLTTLRAWLTGWRGLLQTASAAVIVAYLGSVHALDVGPALGGMSGPVALSVFGVLALGEWGSTRPLPILPLGPRARAVAETVGSSLPIALGCLLEPGALPFVPLLLAAAFVRSAAPGGSIGAAAVLVAFSLPSIPLLALEASGPVVGGVGAAFAVGAVALGPTLERIARVRDPRSHRGPAHRGVSTPWREALRGAATSGLIVFALVSPISIVAAFYSLDSVLEVQCVAVLTAIAFAPHGRPGGLPAGTVSGSLAEAARRLPLRPTRVARVTWLLGLASAATAAALALASLFLLDVYNPGGGASIGLVGLQAVVGGALVFVPMSVWRLLGTPRWKLKVIGIAAAWGLLLVTALPGTIYLVDMYGLPMDLVFVGLIGPLVVPLVAALACYRDVRAPARPA